MGCGASAQTSSASSEDMHAVGPAAHPKSTHTHTGTAHPGRSDDELSDISDSHESELSPATLKSIGWATVQASKADETNASSSNDPEEDQIIYDGIVIVDFKSTPRRPGTANNNGQTVVTMNGGSGLGRKTSNSDFRGGGGPLRGNPQGNRKKIVFNDAEIFIDEFEKFEARAPPLPDSKGSASPAASPSTPPIGVNRSTNGAGAPTRRRQGPPEIVKYDLRTTIGHSSRVKCIAIASGEKEYASSSNEDNSVSYQDIRTGKELGLFCGHSDSIISASFSLCGKYLASTSRDNAMILWDVVTQKAILTFEHAKVVICCVFSRDSKYIATGCQDKICRVWETRRGKEVLAYSLHEGIVIALCFSPDGHYVCSGAADRTVRVWTALKGKTKHLLSGHQGIVLACSYTADGKHIISNDETAVKFWNADDGQLLRTVLVNDVMKYRMPSVAPPTTAAAGAGQPTGAKPAANGAVQGKTTPGAQGAAATGAGAQVAQAKKTTWTLSCAAPGNLVQYAVVACNSRLVFILDIATGAEVLNVFTRAPVYCITSGTNNTVAFGDSSGNIYFLSLYSKEYATTKEEKAALDRARPKMIMS